MLNGVATGSSISESEDDDDDDGLPNEYDYKDSFIDDEDLIDSGRTDQEGRARSQCGLSFHGQSHSF